MPTALPRSRATLALALTMAAAAAVPVRADKPDEVKDPARVRAALEKACAAQAALTSFRATIQETKALTLLPEPQASSLVVEAVKPDQFRLEVKGDEPATVVADGKQLWSYQPKLKLVDRYPLGEGWRDRFPLLTALDDGPAGVERRFQVILYQGAGTRILKLLPTDPTLKRNLKELHLTLGDDELPVELMQKEPNGDKITWVVKKLERNVEIPAARFQFAPPANAKLKDHAEDAE